MFDAKALTLFVDCALKTSVVALAREGKVLARAGSNGEQSHSITLLAAIDQVLSEAGLVLSQIQQVLFSNGPGGFSSLRVGLATLSGLFMGTPTKFFPVSSLLLRCVSQAEDKRVASLMRGPAGQVFVGVQAKGEFQEWSAHIDEAILRLQSFAPEILCGDGVKDLLSAGFANTTAVILPDLVTPEAFLKMGKASPLASVAWQEARLSYFREAV